MAAARKPREQVQALGLSHCVHFAGMLTGMPLMQSYADADLHVLLSHRENFAMVVAEAMAAVLPVLVTEQVGLAEEVAKAGAGYSVRPEIEAIAERWSDLLANPELRASMGQKGRDLVERQFRH